MIGTVGSCRSRSGTCTYANPGNRGTRRMIAHLPADAARSGGGMRVVIGQRELVGRIGLELVQEGGVRLYGDAVERRMKSKDPQPAIAAVGNRLKVGEDLVDQVPIVAQISAM